MIRELEYCRPTYPKKHTFCYCPDIKYYKTNSSLYIMLSGFFDYLVTPEVMGILMSNQPLLKVTKETIKAGWFGKTQQQMNYNINTKDIGFEDKVGAERKITTLNRNNKKKQKPIIEYEIVEAYLDANSGILLKEPEYWIREVTDGTRKAEKDAEYPVQRGKNYCCLDPRCIINAYFKQRDIIEELKEKIASEHKIDITLIDTNLLKEFFNRYLNGLHLYIEKKDEIYKIIFCEPEQSTLESSKACHDSLLSLVDYPLQLSHEANASMTLSELFNAYDKRKFLAVLVGGSISRLFKNPYCDPNLFDNDFQTTGSSSDTMDCLALIPAFSKKNKLTANQYKFCEKVSSDPYSENVDEINLSVHQLVLPSPEPSAKFPVIVESTNVS